MYSGTGDELEESNFVENEELIDAREDDDIKLTSNVQTVWNILNLTQGIGALGIPYAISVGGLLTIPHCLLVGYITNYTSTLIVDSLYQDDIKEARKIRKKVRYEFASIGGDTWTVYGSKIISTIQIVHLFGASMLYLILVHTFIDLLYRDYFQSQTLCIMISGLIITPTALVNNMKQLAWFSLIAICIIDSVFIMFIVMSFLNIKSWSFDLIIFDFVGFSIANCIILFSFVAHPYLPRIENSMMHKEKYNFVSSLSFFTATIIKIFFGTIVVLDYGDTIKQALSENIIQPEMKLCVTCLLGLYGYFSFAMPSTVMVRIIKNSKIDLVKRMFNIPENGNEVMSWSEKIIDVGVRIILIILVTFITIVVPVFSVLMAVFGSVTAMLLTLILPVYFYKVLKSKSWSFKFVGIMLFGIVSGIIGLCTSIWKLIAIVKSKNF